jgi:serine/threonine-protein kinase
MTNGEHLPRRAGRYQLFEVIACGGMGAVLRARDPELHRDLAVKVLLRQHLANPEMRQRFLEEARIAGQLQHPGVVPIHEIGLCDDNRPFFAMKLVEGRTLAQLLAERPSPQHDLPRFLSIFEQVCQTLAYAHSRHVIHRDLKPSNIMVGAFGEVQVMDWGLAKDLSPSVASGSAEVASGEWRVAREEQSTGEKTSEEGRTPPAPLPLATRHSPLATLGGATSAEPRATPLTAIPERTQTEFGRVLGTPEYLAPEQARGDSPHLDEHCDVFGLGALLCEILTGQPPFLAPLSEAALQLAAEADLAGARERLAKCGADSELVELARACLQADPANRPPHAGAVMQKMTAYQAGVAERLRQAELDKAAAQARLKSERRARRLVAGLILAFLLLLVTGVGVGGWVAFRKYQAEEQSSTLLGRVSWLTGPNTSPRDVKAPLRRERKLPEILDRWQRAQVLLQQAGRILETEPANPTLREQIEAQTLRVAEEVGQLARDQILVERLTEIRVWKDDHFDPAEMLQAYEEAFQRYGLDVASLDIPGAASRIRTRPPEVVRELTGALDDWYLLRQRGRVPQADRLLRLAQAIDGDSWRGTLRERMQPQPIALSLLAAGLAQHGGPAWSLLHEGLQRARRRHDLVELAREAEYDPLSPANARILSRFLTEYGACSEAVRVLEAAQRRHPDDLWLVYELGQACLRGPAPRYEAGIRALQAARALRPELGHSLAHALARHGEQEEAVALFRELVLLKPNNPEHHRCLGCLLAERNKSREGIRHLYRAVGLAPGKPAYLVSVGVALTKDRRPAEAIPWLHLALVRDPRSTEARTQLAVALRATGQTGDVDAWLRQANPSQPEQYLLLQKQGMDLLLVGKQYREAAKVLQRAVALKPDLAVLRHQVGYSLVQLGQFEAAARHHEVAVGLDPNNVAFLEHLGTVQIELNRLEEAWATFQQALARHRDEPGILAHLGAIRRAQGRLDEARSLLEKALAGDSRLFLAHQQMGKLLDTLGQPEEGLVHYRRLVECEPGAVVAHFLLGNAYLNLRRTDEAIACYKKAVQLDPNSAESLCNLGIALSRQGRFRDALSWLRRGHEQGTRRPNWSYPSANWVRDCEHNLGLEDSLSLYLDKKRTPASALEFQGLVALCRCRQLHAAEARFYTAWLAGLPDRDPERAELATRAAGAAVLAGCGQGKDVGGLSAEQRRAWRKQAKEWLEAELKRQAELAGSDQAPDRQRAARELETWLNERDLAGVREETSLTELPVEEREQWQAFWAAVRQVRDKARRKSGE